MALSAAAVVVFGGATTAGIWIENYLGNIKSLAESVERSAVSTCRNNKFIDYFLMRLRAENTYAQYLNSKIVLLQHEIHISRSNVDTDELQRSIEKEEANKIVLYQNALRLDEEAKQLARRIDAGEVCNDNTGEKS